MIYYSAKTELFLGAFFQSYITKEYLQKGIDYYQKIGLFNQLTSPEIKAGTKMAFEQYFINFNDVLICFPSLIFHEKETKSRTSGKTYELYKTNENQHFTKEFWQLVALK